MKITVLTIFPEMFFSPLNTSLIKKAQDKGILNIEVVNLRDYAKDKHRQVDDYPFGGGAGMVMKADVLLAALEDRQRQVPRPHTIYLGPQGRKFDQKMAHCLAKKEALLFLCGHYEGVDERALTKVDQVLSIGDYILTGGELAALVVIDAVSRLLPGFLGSEESVQEESFSQGLLEYPHYTRPREVEGLEVPEVLLSGHHEEIRKWRKKESIKRTLLHRPDLLLQEGLDEEGVLMLVELVAKRYRKQEGICTEST